MKPWSQFGQRTLLPTRSSRPLNFLLHSGQVMTDVAAISANPPHPPRAQPDADGGCHPAARAQEGGVVEPLAGPAATAGALFPRIGPAPPRLQELIPPGPETPGRAGAADRALVGIATYNERENLSALVGEIHAFAPAADVLVIDDGSPDGTGRLAEELAADDGRIRVLHRKGKLGLGTAILAGMRYASAHGYDLYVSMDADYSHHPRYLPALLAGMARHDLMIGSRYVPG